jgi:hypothetical protein
VTPRHSRFPSLRIPAALALLALGIVLSACSQAGGGVPAGGAAPAPAPMEKPAADKQPVEPEYTSWVVYINDDDSYSQGDVTYKIALNLTATNPSGDAAGTYSGKATASTSTQGSVRGQPLSAQAIANSGTLRFTLQDATGGGALAGLSTETADAMLLSGKGTITMNASGSGTIGQAGGSFGNSSGQQIDVQVAGSKVTLSVSISGHMYKFNGTISGK